MNATPAESALQDEARTLRRFLDQQRSAVLAIVDGLDEQAWHRPIVPSGWTPGGLLAHLGGAERHWFQDVETACHSGHLDIAREMADGTTNLGAR